MFSVRSCGLLFTNGSLLYLLIPDLQPVKELLEELGCFHGYKAKGCHALVYARLSVLAVGLYDGGRKRYAIPRPENTEPRRKEPIEFEILDLR